MEANNDDPYPGIIFLTSFLDPAVLFYSINGIILAVLLLFSALMSGLEAAFFSLSADDIVKCNTGKSTAEKKVVRLLRHPRRLLAGVLVLSNLVNLTFVALTAYLAWKTVGVGTVAGVMVVILAVLISFVIIFFVRLLSRVYASKNNLVFALTTAPGLKMAEFILKPASRLLLAFPRVLDKRVRKEGYTIFSGGLNEILKASHPENQEGKGILKSLVNFRTLTVKQIMRSRMDITTFDTKMNFRDLMEKVKECGYSRIPVYTETIDKIEGVLYVKDLLPYIDSGEEFGWQSLVRPALFVPEGKKIDALLKDFQEKRVHMAIVVDEYGGTSGLVTMEDIIEEIIGEINDEFDEDENTYIKLKENTYIFEGRTSVHDFCKIFNQDASLFDEVKDDRESLGGLLLEIYSKLPRVGETVEFDRFTFTVVSVDAKRIKKVRVTFTPERIDQEELVRHRENS